MGKTAEVISPIAIDLGAKKTGVYYAHYEAGKKLSAIKEKEGKVYQLEKDNYTLLMASRTATRHQRRGFDRQQLVKRLFRLIWEKHFGLEWDKNVQQTVSFLLNRRGFTFLTEGYDENILSQFPKEAYEELPDEVKDKIKEDIEENNGGYDFDSVLQAWSKEGLDFLQQKFNSINKEPKNIAQRQVFIGRIKELKRYCQDNKRDDINKDQKKSKLFDVSNWIIEKWQEKGVKGLPFNDDNKTKIDLIEYLKNQDEQTRKDILNSLPDITLEDAKLKKSIWNFKSESFNLEIDKEKFNITDSKGNETEKPCVKTHLNHLTFAVYKNLEELKSGGRHRSKYFEEVKNVLNLGKENNDSNDKKNSVKQHKFLIDFCQKLKSGQFKDLNEEKLTCLIGHLSNLELKPLRKYFDDRCQPKPCKDNKCCNGKKQIENDYWCECRLSFLFNRWILHEWRVNPEKDKNKTKDKPEDYEKLKKEWKEHCRDENKEQPKAVIDFWLKTCPELTIPPYQDNNNRRPPKCQSLILNPQFLDQEYSQWQDWLTKLIEISEVKEYLNNFESKLKSLESSKGKNLKDLKNGKDKFRDKSYFVLEDSEEQKNKPSKYKRSIKDLEARTLQFIFDRVKATDPLNLNEIYSHAKKIKQDKCQDNEKDHQETKEKLKEAIEKSKLPDGLKNTPEFESDDIFKKGSFLHLICKYYKLRQRAKGGRLFIHPEYRYIKDKGRGYENTGRFDDKGHLLMYCNHKPRQKRYQMLYDIASIFQVSPEDLREIIQSGGTNTDEKCLIKWLESENFKGLKTNCEKASKAQKDHRGELKSLMNKAIQDKNGDLYKLHKKIEELSKNIGEALFGVVDDIDEDAINSFDQKVKKFNSVFSFAQINNIAFKERSGNAKTCAVCSLDNAQRMVQIPLKDSIDTTAKAQRLPAIETRLIDGAVMRMARIVGDAIAKDKWEKIKDELIQGHKVCVPIITESNRFEFEPSLKDLKDKKNKKDTQSKTQEDIYKSKKERIKDAGQKICPYCEEGISEGDLDHIIPRTSEYGTLNDEANLIFTCPSCNRDKKGNQEYSLNDLKPKYKQEQFGTKDNKAITKWIVDQIDKDEDFKFGKYRSFINLTSNEQKAFRHALFLVGHSVCKKVLEAIQHRNKTFVNGTQRYFAQVVANKLYKKAKAIEKQQLLSFDYFGVQAQSSTRGDGIYDLRKNYENFEEDNPGIFTKYKKESNYSQQPYSHIIDATLAFAIVADQHKNEGSLKLEIDDGIRLWPLDEDTEEVFENTFFHKIKIPEENINKCLERRKTYDIETHHRQLLNKGKKKQIRISYKIHRDNSIGERFFPLLEFKDGNIKKGFHPNNSILYRRKDFELLAPFLQLSEKNKNKNYQVWVINKNQAQKFLIDIGIKGNHSNKGKIAKLLDDLSYQTVKKEISKVLTGNNNKLPQTVKDAQENWNKRIKENDFKKDNILLPFYGTWQRLKSELDKVDDPNQNLQDFLKELSSKDKSLFHNEFIHEHQKVKKVYSLPMKATIGNIRLKRKTWDNNTIIQTVAEESLSKYGYDGKDRPHTILSKNSVPKKHYSRLPSDSEQIPQPREWISIPLNEIKDNDITIQEAWIIYQDPGRCKVKIIIDVNDVNGLSIPGNESWKGKIIRYTSEAELEKAKQKDQQNHHCLSSSFKWVSSFNLSKDRNKVEIQRISNSLSVVFTVQQTAQIKRWIRGNQ